jgi:hypothetical protein
LFRLFKNSDATIGNGFVINSDFVHYPIEIIRKNGRFSFADVKILGIGGEWN